MKCWCWPMLLSVRNSVLALPQKSLKIWMQVPWSALRLLCSNYVGDVAMPGGWLVLSTCPVCSHSAGMIFNMNPLSSPLLVKVSNNVKLIPSQWDLTTYFSLQMFTKSRIAWPQDKGKKRFRSMGRDEAQVRIAAISWQQWPGHCQIVQPKLMPGEGKVKGQGSTSQQVGQGHWVRPQGAENKVLPELRCSHYTILMMPSVLRTTLTESIQHGTPRLLRTNGLSPFYMEGHHKMYLRWYIETKNWKPAVYVRDYSRGIYREVEDDMKKGRHSEKGGLLSTFLCGQQPLPHVFHPTHCDFIFTKIFLQLNKKTLCLYQNESCLQLPCTHQDLRLFTLPGNYYRWE